MTLKSRRKNSPLNFNDIKVAQEELPAMTVLDRPIPGVSCAPATSSTTPPGPLKRTLRYLEATYSLDLRSLALFRIALGAVLLGDLIWRARDLTVFYTDFGVLPRAALLDKFSPGSPGALDGVGYHWYSLLS